MQIEGTGGFECKLRELEGSHGKVEGMRRPSRRYSKRKYLGNFDSRAAGEDGTRGEVGRDDEFWQRGIVLGGDARVARLGCHWQSGVGAALGLEPESAPAGRHWGGTHSHNTGFLFAKPHRAAAAVSADGSDAGRRKPYGLPVDDNRRSAAGAAIPGRPTHLRGTVGPALTAANHRVTQRRLRHTVRPAWGRTRRQDHWHRVTQRHGSSQSGPRSLPRPSRLKHEPAGSNARTLLRLADQSSIKLLWIIGRRGP